MTASRIDLLIRQSAEVPDTLEVFLSAPSRQEAFLVKTPDALLELHSLWRQRFLRHHDPAFPWPEGAAVVTSYSERMLQGLEAWLAEPAWLALAQVLQSLPQCPLALRVEGVAEAIRALPWEALPLQRPIWRLDQHPVASVDRPRPGPRARQPRILLLLGSEQGLDLSNEVERLQQLQRSGRIGLKVQRGSTSSPSQLRQALGQATGWDALLFLGHSSSGPKGGALHFGDGSQLDGELLEKDWALAARHGLRLLLFNSCSGLQLGHHAARAGIDWAICFLEPVPAAAAGLAFEQLLAAMEQGCELQQAIQATRSYLARAAGCEGCSLLLAAVAAADAMPFQLPLRRRRQLALRLAQTTATQGLIAIALTLAAFGMELTPTNPWNTYMLNRRLEVQRIWRRVIHQPGPSPTGMARPISVLLLDPATTIPALGAQPSSDHTPRQALAAVLRRTPVVQVPVVGLDVVLDQPRNGDAELAAVIQSQSQRQVVGGYWGPFSDPTQGSGANDWLLNSPLVKAGLKPVDLAVGTAAAGGVLKPVPLQLQAAITDHNFAGAMATISDPLLPADRVIDWSINWADWIRLVDVQDLERLKAPVLLVGTSGRLGDSSVDLFSAPATVQNALQRGDQPLWQGNAREIPGVIVQAVLTQSLNLRYWLTPLSVTLCTLAAAALGILVAALVESRRDRFAVVAVITLASLPLVLTVAVFQLWLVPFVLPCLALFATAYSRDD